MQMKLDGKARQFKVDQYFSDDVNLPRKLELVDGEIGPFSEKAKLALLANWGADEILRLTGSEIWHEAIKAFERENRE